MNSAEQNEELPPPLDKATLKSALKAFRKRLKRLRLDDESSIGGGAMSGGRKSGISGIKPPDRFPPEVWEELARRGSLKALGPGLYELVE